LAGEGDCAEEIFLIPNALRSTTRFRMAPQEQVDALLAIERHGWRLLAIYHSHPEGPPNPSPTDISEASYPEAFTLIWSPDGHQWGCRGFQIRADGFDEIHLVVE
jgi:[CysO sulfur-carrier protein]-S-L-cysteine hydrolase